MNFNILIKNSQSIKLLRSWHFRLIEIYGNSHIYKLINRFVQIIKVGFRYSFLQFLHRIFTIDIEMNMLTIKESFFASFSINLFTKTKRCSDNYLATSEISSWIREQCRILQICAPLKNISIVIILTILVNIFFLILFNVKIGLSGWVIRSVFLFLGVSGLLCNADWQDIRKTSLFLDNLRRKLK